MPAPAEEQSVLAGIPTTLPALTRAWKLQAKASTVGFDRMGGYWNVDRVRLSDSAVPNSSFEVPATDFASPAMEGWQKAPQTFRNNDPFFPWHQLMGQFLNTTNGSADHIANLEGRQAAFLFALPDVAIFQDRETIGGTNAAPRVCILTIGAILPVSPKS